MEESSIPDAALQYAKLAEMSVFTMNDLETYMSASHGKIDKSKSQAFIRDILAIYDKHGLAISHEDGQGAFIVDYDATGLRAWIMSAHNGSEIEAEPVFSDAEVSGEIMCKSERQTR